MTNDNFKDSYLAKKVGAFFDDVDPANFFIFSQNKEGNEKLVIGSKGGIHLTFHFGMKSKVADIHFTSEQSNEHETLLQISHYKIARYVIKAKTMLQNLVDELDLSRKNTINLGKLKRFNKLMIPFGQDISILSDLIKTRNRGKKIKVRPDYNLNAFAEKALLFPEELPNSSSQMFFIVSYTGTISGVVMKDPRSVQGKRFIWFTKHQFNKVIFQIKKLFLDQFV